MLVTDCAKLTPIADISDCYLIPIESVASVTSQKIDTQIGRQAGAAECWHALHAGMADRHGRQAGMHGGQARQRHSRQAGTAGVHGEQAGQWVRRAGTVGGHGRQARQVGRHCTEDLGHEK
jgi:hypothetical protein